MDYNKLYRNLLIKLRECQNDEEKLYSKHRTSSEECKKWEIYEHSKELLSEIFENALSVMNVEYLKPNEEEE